MFTRDGYVSEPSEPWYAGHRWIDAYLEDLAATKPRGVYSSDIAHADYAQGRAIAAASGADRALIAAAALARYTAAKRDYTGGSYSPDEFSVHDYHTVLERLASALLRAKLPFSEAVLVRLVDDVADHAANNVRSFPIKPLLGQVEALVKREGALPAGCVPALKRILKIVREDAASYTTSPPAVLGQIAERVTALLASAPPKRATKPRSRR